MNHTPRVTPERDGGGVVILPGIIGVCPVHRITPGAVPARRTGSEWKVLGRTLPAESAQSGGGESPSCRHGPDGASASRPTSGARCLRGECVRMLW